MNEHVTARLIECNEWLASPENDDAPKWLRDLVIYTRNWVISISEIAGD